MPGADGMQLGNQSMENLDKYAKHTLNTYDFDVTSTKGLLGDH
jgi:hypothetical protein